MEDLAALEQVKCTACDWTGPVTAAAGFAQCDCPCCLAPVTGVTERSPVSLSAVPGTVLGVPYPDWPEDLTTFAERKAYQRGVAHARATDAASPSRATQGGKMSEELPAPATAKDRAIYQGLADGYFRDRKCSHRIADARNKLIQSGYVCIDCGAIFEAADHGAAIRKGETP